MATYFTTTSSNTALLTAELWPNVNNKNQNMFYSMNVLSYNTNSFFISPAINLFLYFCSKFGVLDFMPLSCLRDFYQLIHIDSN